MPKVCDMDCFNCKFDDCIKDDVYRETSRYCNLTEHCKRYENEYGKKRRAEAKQKNYCVRCLKRPATHGSQCYECYIRGKSYYQKHKPNTRILWREEGKCYFCGNEVIKGKKVCEKHYLILCNNAEKAHKSPQTKNFVEWHWRHRKGEHNEKQM